MSATVHMILAEFRPRNDSKMISFHTLQYFHVGFTIRDVIVISVRYNAPVCTNIDVMMVIF